MYKILFLPMYLFTTTKLLKLHKTDNGHAVNLNQVPTAQSSLKCSVHTKVSIHLDISTGEGASSSSIRFITALIPREHTSQMKA